MLNHLIKIMLAVLLVFCNQLSFASTDTASARKPNQKSLELAAKAIQSHIPLQGFNIFLMAFHPLKENPSHQMAAYHYCKQNSQKILQCIIFDNDDNDAHISGIEYIIPEQYYDKLPQEEKKYWHPHNYEILSGELIAPRIPKLAENKMLAEKMNSYGKTYHFMLENVSGSTNQDGFIPIGKPTLAWSFNHPNEINPVLLAARDKKYHVNTQQISRGRQTLIKLAHPQCGVNALNKYFPAQNRSMAGVMAKSNC